MRVARPHDNALFCHQCQCWWVRFITKVSGKGWTLCAQCHDGPKTKSFEDIPWEQRRIRLLGVPGESKYDRLHHRTLGEPESDTKH